MAATTDQITYDASAVGSQACRRHIEGTLEGLSLARAEGAWRLIKGVRRRFPRTRTVVVGDLHKLTSSVTLDDLAAGPSSLSYVLLVRTELDRKRLAEPDVALRLNDDRFFVFELECAESREPSFYALSTRTSAASLSDCSPTGSGPPSSQRSTASCGSSSAMA